MPAWARVKREPHQQLDPAFLAGAALASLDPVARLDEPWTGAWRQRLALRAAALTTAGRGADEATLRDTWHLTRAAADPGPAGRAYGAWRDLVRRSPSLSAERLGRAAEAFGLTPYVVAGLSFDELPKAPLAAAAAALVTTLERDRRAQPLALWLADLVLAERLRWPVPVPLLAIGLGGRLRVVREGRGPEREAAVATACASGAAAALDLAGDLARRAEQLTAVAPRLRAKASDRVVAKLLDDDAVAAAAAPGLSDRGARRLFDRLVALGAVRELTGRTTSRLYGL